jgi:subtilisin-like proprotein convertase family protein
MTRFKICITLMFLLASVLYSQNTPIKQWSAVYNNGSANNNMTDLAVDGDGNSYYACSKPGSNGWGVPYLLKYNSAGVQQFSKVYEPLPYPRGIKNAAGITIDGNNNIYMAGTYDSGVVYIGFVAKFNSAGDTVWTRKLGGGADTNTNVAWSSIITDNSGNIYVSGARYIFTPSLVVCMYTAKYSSAGNLLWIANHPFTVGYITENQKNPITLDNNGNVIVTYSYKKNNISGDPDYDIIAAKYSPAGTELWYSSYNTPGNQSDNPWDIDVDNNGNAYIAASCNVFTAPYTISDLTCLKFDGSSGALNWAFKTRGSYASTTSENIARSITVNRNTNEVYLAGSLHNTVEGYEGALIKLSASTGTEIWRKFTPHVFEERLSNVLLGTGGDIYVNGQNYAFGSNYHIYTAKYNQTGDLLWKTSYNVTRQMGQLFLKGGPFNSLYMGSTLAGTPTDVVVAKYLEVTPQTQTFCRSVSKPILDNQHTYDTVNVSGLPPQAIITRIEVKIDTILHTYAPDMQATLRSPQGLVDTLFKNPGSVIGGTNMINCVITDTASVQLNAVAIPPFTGYYRPHSPLSAYEGYEPNGNWILSIYDNLNAETGTLKKYCLVVHYYDLATIGIQQVSNEVPKQYSLGQNYPNPFNPTTNIKFSIPKSGNVTLKVYDILGKQVAELVNEYKTAGSYIADFNAAHLSSGVYFYRLETEGLIETKKMLLVK